ncbi:MAG: RluA family pseudouridine synthase [Pirellulales bacterium]|nr:RluA family pseudouridine synthase [Pirellulales bacterium]
MPPLDILFEDDHLLVVNKPAGLSTQAPAGIESLEMCVREYLQSKRPQGAMPLQRIYLGVPHRLDRSVSGVIVFAKTIKAARKLSKQFERRRVRKTYLAELEGAVNPFDGMWTDALRKVPHEARVEIVEADHPEGRQAILRYRTIDTTQHGCLLEIEPETGRMHQIRVQSASRGWPVLGDAQYGSRLPFGEQFDDVRRRAIALHAHQISFTPPGGLQSVTFTAPLSANWPTQNQPKLPRPHAAQRE